MKNEDFDRLKKLCDENGFEMSYDHKDCETFNISTKKDIWQGVEFAYNLYQKIVYKVKSKTETHIICFNGPTIWKTEFDPSTQQAYEEQLKANAFDLYGDIKLGDSFDRLGLKFLDISLPQIIVIGAYVGLKDFVYFKSNDSLEFDGYIIYQKGKWAKKLPKRIEVKLAGLNVLGKSFYFEYEKDGQEKIINIGSIKTGDFLAKQLEKYLNGEIE